MNKRPQAIFRTADEALNALFSMLVRLSRLVMWLMIGFAHLALLLAGLIGCWIAGLTAQDLQQAYLHMRQQTPVEVLSFLGVSVGTLFAIYLWLLRKLHLAAGKGWLYDYLMKSLPTR